MVLGMNVKTILAKFSLSCLINGITGQVEAHELNLSGKETYQAWPKCSQREDQ